MFVPFALHRNTTVIGMENVLLLLAYELLPLEYLGNGRIRMIESFTRVLV